MSYLSESQVNYGTIVQKYKCIGREIFYNWNSELYNNSSDPPEGYAILTASGNFKGGHLRIPHLGLRIQLEPIYVLP